MKNDENHYYDQTLRLIEDAYVENDQRGDIAGGSGSGGGLDRWEQKRRVIADAFDHDGTWLDVGCANGLLMETLPVWTAHKGARIEPYGLELSDRIAARARIRLHHLSNRIWTGNVMTWEPPMRFSYATLLPEYVPGDKLAAMLERVRDCFLEERGRLVLSCYFPRPTGMVTTTAGLLLRELGLAPTGDSIAHREDGSIWTSVAWIDVR